MQKRVKKKKENQNLFALYNIIIIKRLNGRDKLKHIRH